MVNANSPETSNLEKMTSEVTPQDSNNQNKNKEHENVCTISFKLWEKCVSIAKIYDAWFGIETYKRTLSGEIYSLETLHPEWRNNNNSAFKKELSRLWLIVSTVTTLASSMSNPYRRDNPPKKRSIFVIKTFIKKLPKGGKLNDIFLHKNTQKYIYW